MSDRVFFTAGLCMLVAALTLAGFCGCSLLSGGNDFWSVDQGDNTRLLTRIGVSVLVSQTSLSPEQTDRLVRYLHTARQVLLNPEGPDFDAAISLASSEIQDVQVRPVAILIINLIEQIWGNHQAPADWRTAQVILGAAVDGAVEALEQS